jgi:hypothetical protein
LWDQRTVSRLELLFGDMKAALDTGMPPDQVIAHLDAALASVCPALYKPWGAILDAERAKSMRGYMDDGGGSGGDDDGRTGDKADAAAPVQPVAQAAQHGGVPRDNDGRPSAGAASEFSPLGHQVVRPPAAATRLVAPLGAQPARAPGADAALTQSTTVKQ